MLPSTYKTYSALKQLTGILLVLSVLSSCTELIEPNLAKESIKIIAPTNNLQTTRLTHTFLWDNMDNAEGYRLQIVRPSFQEVQQLVLNEELTENQFEYTLSPGNYQWRVQAFNNGSMTNYKTYNLIIDSTLELTDAVVILDSPASDFFTNDETPNFSWFKIDVANSYRFHLRSPDFNGEDEINPVTTTSTSYQITEAINEGEYEWFVVAINEFSETQFVNPRKITVDITTPGKPSLTQPKNNAFLSDSTFTFSWNRVTDNGSALADSVYIYEDSNLKILNQRRVNSTTSFTDSLGSGEYFWLVKTFDLAGNVSESSSVSKFTVQ